MKVKVNYLIASTVEELQEEVDKELEALQVNKKVRVLDVKTTATGTEFLSQIAYMILEDPEPMQILNEGEKVCSCE